MAVKVAGWLSRSAPPLSHPTTQQQSHNVSIAIVGLPIRLDPQKFAVRLSNSAVRGEAILRVSESLPQTIDITRKHKEYILQAQQEIRLS